MEPEAEQPPAALGRRQERRPRDMAMSLLVLLVPIVLLLAFYRVVLSGDAPATVDPAPTLQQARSAGAFPVLAPAGLGDDWHVTTASFRTAPEGATLRLGYVAPDDDPALLVQSSVAPETLLRTELGDDARPTESFRASNGVWRQYSARRNETALVLAGAGRTVIVIGAADEEHLEALAGSLR